MTSLRCQWGAVDCTIDYRDAQCVLVDGHPGPHRTGEHLARDRELNKHPTLEAIRQVVREEIARAASNADGEPYHPKRDCPWKCPPGSIGCLCERHADKAGVSPSK